MKYYILYNPMAGNGSAKEDAVKLAEKLGMYLLPDVFFIDKETQTMHLFYALSKTMYSS